MLSRWRRLRVGATVPSCDLSLARRVVVLEEGQTPSGDYILHPWLAGLGLPVLRLDSRLPVSAPALQAGDFVVVLRYVHAPWQRLLSARRGELAGLAWFLDDDLLDPEALRGLPSDYARKIERQALAWRSWFQSMGAQWWFATPALGHKYAALSPRVLPLAPPPRLQQPQEGAVRVVYHGSASHQAELQWLRQVLSEVQGRSDQLHIEVIGDLAVNRAWRDLPRVTVLHPMSWPSYLAYTASHCADIGLAPLLPSPFNAGRGAVKFYDYARMGAVGLFSREGPYQSVVRDGVDGLLLDNDPALWAERLLALSGDTVWRQRLRTALVTRVRAELDPARCPNP